MARGRGGHGPDRVARGERGVSEELPLPAWASEAVASRAGRAVAETLATLDQSAAPELRNAAGERLGQIIGDQSLTLDQRAALVFVSQGAALTVQAQLEAARETQRILSAGPIPRDYAEAIGLAPPTTWRSRVAAVLDRSAAALNRLALRVDPPGG